MDGKGNEQIFLKTREGTKSGPTNHPIILSNLF